MLLSNNIIKNLKEYSNKILKVEEWQQIEFGLAWNDNTGNYTIYCTNGTIAKDGTITYN